MRFQLKKPRTTNQKGAALTEYGIIVGLIAVVSIAATLSLGEEVEENFDQVGLEMQYVQKGRLYNPYDHCMETVEAGFECDKIPFLPIPDGHGGTFLAETAASAGVDPQRTWRNSNVTSTTGYAYREGGGDRNHRELIAHAVNHAAAQYCESRGLTLPNKQQLIAMNDYRVELGLLETLYHSSSQHANGSYTAGPSQDWANSNRHFMYYIGSAPIENGSYGSSANVRCVR